MRDKFNLLTNLLRGTFGASEYERSFETLNKEVKLIFKPFEIVEVSNYDAI